MEKLNVYELDYICRDCNNIHQYNTPIHANCSAVALIAAIVMRPRALAICVKMHEQRSAAWGGIVIVYENDGLLHSQVFHEGQGDEIIRNPQSGAYAAMKKEAEAFISKQKKAGKLRAVVYPFWAESFRPEFSHTGPH